jgi:NAD(P)-dependent dehydrogenase (short-subunit alcohol dehydrogenase family)
MTLLPNDVFSGKTAVVTGAARGIGLAIACDFLKRGAHVALMDIAAEVDIGRYLEENLPTKNWKYFQVDVSLFEEVQQSLERAQKEFSSVDFLVNNAGINRDAVIWKMTEEDWDQVLAVDLKGCFNFSRALAPHFRKKGFGRIVNISSINGLRGKFGQVNYAAAKAGVIGLSKSLARELGASRVTVNAICPGLIESEMTKKLPEKFLEKARQESVLPDPGLPEDIAMTVAFFCSDMARHITGEVIRVDGGQYI